ncbi:BON domain-containing protein [Luteimonas sp. 8-5]|uniref:BON domain-containing protein n=1 Tax=Luteimonas sp. 8-5 TaxID=3039387 RepID=UPI002436587F|nr:BON domain-containing protein [Luteimonas sp. 8-5]MDG6348313.1 BON domain-containing protein [Luteimonas sp. 8-5]
MARQQSRENLYNGLPSVTSHRGKGPAGYVRPDASIADDIVDRLTEDDSLDASQILLQVDGGIAILTGNVPSRAMKHRAEDLAAAASGVRDVRNRIRVDDGSASGGPPGKAVRQGRD